jgi:hypothetical protein
LPSLYLSNVKVEQRCKKPTYHKQKTLKLNIFVLLSFSKTLNFATKKQGGFHLLKTQCSMLFHGASCSAKIPWQKEASG